MTLSVTRLIEMLQKYYKPNELVCQAIFSETETLNEIKERYNLTDDEMIDFISEMEDRLHSEFHESAEYIIKDIIRA